MVGLTRSGTPGTPEEDTQLFVVTRKQWNAHPPGEGIPKLRHPLERVRFTHTATDPCGTFAECKKTLKKIQFEHMDMYGHPDIQYNFMIGGDGWIFEGRGWDFEPELPPTHVNMADQTLQIAYIGDYEEETPPPQLLKAGMEILVYGTRKELLFHFYDVSHLS